MSHPTLLQALQSTDMLEIDDLYAWQFSLDRDLLAQLDDGSAGPSSHDQRLLSVECVDGRAQRRWQFSLAAVLAASFDPASDSWSLSSDGKEHRIKCFAAISGDNADADSDEVDPS